ncbi:MAG TPA: S41 family peptidase [Kiritimatiellia bacterium]|nr:S41 family peptidase [Kiritimatiellia bacterium]
MTIATSLIRSPLFLAAFVCGLSAVSLHGQNGGEPETPATTNGIAPTLAKQLEALGLDVDLEQANRATTLAVVQTLDPQARIVTEEDWIALRDQREGWWYLPGFRITMSNGFPVIQDILPGSPAEAAGLLTGDVILETGTNRITRISLPEAQNRLRAVQAGDFNLRTVRGDATNRVTLTLVRLPQPAIETAELFPNHMGYIKVNGLYPGAGRDIVSQVRAWSETGRDGVLLDLRGAGGADTAAIVHVASLFAVGGQFLFAFRDHHHQDLEVFKATDGKPVTLPLMVLIDRDTRGAAEILAAVLNHVARTSLLIGETTAGDFNLREVVTLGGQPVYLATKVVDTADGWRYNGQFGVEPSVFIPEDQRDTHPYEPAVDPLDRRQRLEIEDRDAALRRRVRGDGVLERAVDIVVGLKSLHKGGGAVSSSDP